MTASGQRADSRSCSPPARPRRPGNTPDRAADVKLRSQVSNRGRIVVVPHSSSPPAPWRSRPPRRRSRRPGQPSWPHPTKDRGRCPPPRDGRVRPTWRARPPRRAGGRSTSSSGRAPAGRTRRGRPRPNLNARNRRSGSGHRGTERCPGRRHRGRGRGNPFRSAAKKAWPISVPAATAARLAAGPRRGRRPCPGPRRAARAGSRGGGP